jgi:iron(III) transport system ATP-binding protein
LILLDEPFSALDAVLRDELRSEVVGLLRKLGSTAILVTHDREEALVSSDRVVLMRSGRVVQDGTPEEVYEAPISPEIAASTGDVLVLAAQKLTDGQTRYPLSLSGIAEVGSDTGYVVIRPEEIQVSSNSVEGIEGSLIHIDYYGHDAMLTVEVLNSPTPIKARVVGPTQFVLGQKVYLKHIGPVRYFARQ